METTQEDQLICVGKITSAHGIKGAVNIQAYTDAPGEFADYSPFYDAKGEKQYDLKVVSSKKDKVVALIQGCSSRNEAEELRGKELFIYRSALPATLMDNEFYIEDLIGLKAVLYNGTIFGEITSVHNYGSCDILEILCKDNNKEELIAFTEEFVPEVNLKDGYVVIDPPEIEFVSDNDNQKPEEGDSPPSTNA